jgi:RNA polymerase sigma-70 factor, ECF subfamily
MISLVSTAPESQARPSGSRDLDRATFLRAQRGDPIAFRAFVVRYERPVFALLSRLVGRGPELEDLAQETFLRAFRALPGFDLDGAARPSTWLLTIATRLALDVRRKKRPPLEALSDLNLASGERSPEHGARDSELGRAIARAASELPDDQRAAFVLSEFHGLSIAEIAGALGAPEGTIKTRLFRAREKLKLALAPFTEEP